MVFEELTHRKRLDDEKVEVYAHKIIDLVKYAYQKFDQESRDKLAKDYFVTGLQFDVQKELRKMDAFEDKRIAELSKQTTYLEIANANAAASQTKEQILAVNPHISGLDERMDKLITLMEKTLAVQHQNEYRDEGEEKMNYAGFNRGNFTNQFSHGRGRGRSRGRSGGIGGRQQPLKCRVCNSTDHLFGKCPERFCQACGKKGHDGLQTECPKYR